MVYIVALADHPPRIYKPMVQQLGLLGSEDRIIPTALHSEMQQSYLEYAMSVIVGRALPDVRDGLKPVHRRILFAMHELGLTPDRPFRKCARVVGDVLGKYHPHGDQSVYDALVRLVQDFSSRYPLLGGHGNFGSVDNDPPAAMRYTETRLSSIGHSAVLGEISTATVDFIGNFDNSQQEPTVLPAEFPLLLVNGCSGIAVGMATNVPPHNLGEVIDGLIALIDNPNLPDHELWTIIPGPDFPTGGEILGNEGICEAYRSGKGIIPVRGVVHLEAANQQVRQIKSRKRRDALIVTELPYQVNKAGLIERIAELVNNGKIEGIADLRDESDREGMRVVIEIKRDSDAQKVLECLYKQTALQSNFGAIFLALVDSLPKQLSLRQVLQEFLKFREETLTRQYNNDLQQFQQRAHLVTGLLTALENLDGLIEILRHAPDGSTAKGQMIERFELSIEQADAILAMPMRRLTGLERHNLAKEGEELNDKIAKLQKLLGDRRELLKSMKKDLRALRKQHADERRTRILDFQPPESFVPRVVVPRTPKAVQTDASIENLEELSELADSLGPEVMPVQPATAAGNQTELLSIPAATVGSTVSREIDNSMPTASLSLEQPNVVQDANIPILSAAGEESDISADLEPHNQAAAASGSLVLPVAPQPTVAAPRGPKASRSQQMNLLSVHPSAPQMVDLEFMSSGRVRRVDRPECRFAGDGELLMERRSVMSDREIMVIASNGKSYLVKVSSIPPTTNRQSLGIELQAVIPGLSEMETAIQQLSDTAPMAILLVSAQGRIKRLPIEELAATTSRGLALMKIPDGDRLVAAVPLTNESELILGTSSGRLLRLALNSNQIPLQGRPAQGLQGMRIGGKEHLAVCLPVRASDNLLLITSLGYGKQMPVSALRLMSIGSMGDIGLRFSDGRDHLLQGLLARPHSELLALTDGGRQLSLLVDRVPLLGKEGVGDRLFELNPEERLQNLLLTDG
jgi:DNA gyrase subunit A